MARTKNTPRKSKGGKAPRTQHKKAAPGCGKFPIRRKGPSSFHFISCISAIQGKDLIDPKLREHLRELLQQVRKVGQLHKSELTLRRRISDGYKLRLKDFVKSHKTELISPLAIPVRVRFGSYKNGQTMFSTEFLGFDGISSIPRSAFPETYYSMLDTISMTKKESKTWMSLTSPPEEIAKVQELLKDAYIQKSQLQEQKYSQLRQELSLITIKAEEAKEQLEIAFKASKEMIRCFGPDSSLNDADVRAFFDSFEEFENAAAPPVEEDEGADGEEYVEIEDEAVSDNINDEGVLGSRDD